MYGILLILLLLPASALANVIVHDLYHRFDRNAIRSYIYQNVTAIKDRYRRIRTRTVTKEEARQRRLESATKRMNSNCSTINDDEVNDEENALMPDVIATHTEEIHQQEIHQQEIHPNTMVAVALPTDPIDTTRDGVRNRTANAICKHLPQDRLHRLEETGKIDLLMKNV